MLEIIFFGLLQGLFEWLPISSQGNIVLLMVSFFGFNAEQAVNLAIFLHTGTMLSAIIYFRKELIELIKSLKKFKPEFNEEKNSLISFLLISTFLTGLIGFPLYLFISDLSIQGELFIVLIGLALIFSGLIQKITENKKNEFKKLNLFDSILLGLMQGLAVIPGISRSGITVSGMLLRNYNSEQALKYSFLMSIPAVFAAEIGLGLIKGLPVINLTEALIGLTASFLTGLISIHLLLKLSKKIKFWKFCILIGLISLIPFFIL
jgi:undecaprenyl-diphosphatase